MAEKYWIMECTQPYDWDDCAILDIAPMPEGATSWLHGKHFPKPVKEPLEFTMIEDHNDRLTEMDSSEALVITKKLYEALLEAGVKNLDAYKAEIKHATLPTVLKNYVACNIIGLVTAADMKKSKVTGKDVDLGFDSLKIDEQKAGASELLMFRLKESPNAIVVHDSVRKYLLKKGFTMLTFTDPKEWIG